MNYTGATYTAEFKIQKRKFHRRMIFLTDENCKMCCKHFFRGKAVYIYISQIVLWLETILFLSHWMTQYCVDRKISFLHSATTKKFWCSPSDFSLCVIDPNFFSLRGQSCLAVLHKNVSPGPLTDPYLSGFNGELGPTHSYFCCYKRAQNLQVLFKHILLCNTSDFCVWGKTIKLTFCMVYSFTWFCRQR